MPSDVGGTEALDTSPWRGFGAHGAARVIVTLRQLCCGGFAVTSVIHFSPQHALPLPGFIFLASDIYEHVVLFNKSGKSGVMWQDSLLVSEAKPHFLQLAQLQLYLVFIGTFAPPDVQEELLISSCSSGNFPILQE